MGQDLSGVSEEELRSIIAPPESNLDRFIHSVKNQAAKVPDIANRFIHGANRGGLGLLTLPAEVAALPYNMYQQATGGERFSPYSELAGVFNIEHGKQGDVAGNLGEGAVGGMFGGVPGAIVGSTTDAAVKSAFPNSPLAQTAASLAMPVVGGVLAARSSKVNPSVSPKTGETGITLTRGQYAGDEKALVREHGIESNVHGRTAFKELADAQYKTTTDYANNIQNLLGRTDLTATQIRDGVVKQMNIASDAVLNRFKAVNNANFTAARQTAGDVRLFDTTHVIDALDRKIALYSEPTMPPELQAVANGLRELRESFVTKGTPAQSIPSKIMGADGNPISVQQIPATADALKKLTIEELQKHLESLGSAAKTGSYSNPGVKTSSFSGAAPGTVKGIARDVLRGFKDDLDAANLQGIPGSRELIKARDGFKAGIKDMNDFASRPLVKRLNLESESAITPEAVVQGLLKAPATERKAIFELVQQSHPEIYQSLRYRAMQEFLNNPKNSTDLLASMNKIKAKAASERVGNTSDGIPFDDFLFPTGVEKAKFVSLNNDLNMIANKASSYDSGKMNAMNPASDVSSLAGGSVARYTARTAVDLWRFLSSPNVDKTAIMMTSPDAANAIRQVARMKAGVVVPKDIWDKIYPYTQLNKATATGGFGSAIEAHDVTPGASANRSQESDVSKATTEELQKIIGEGQ